MTKKGVSRIQRGQAITFRLPSDTPDHILQQIQKLKETERRNFSSKIADFVLDGVNTTLAKEKETVTIPLPRKLTKEQRNWLKHTHSEALLGSIVYQLLADPVRASSVLASLNSNAIDIEDALYLQEKEPLTFDSDFSAENDRSIGNEESKEIIHNSHSASNNDADLMNFDFAKAKQELASSIEETQEEDEEPEDLLGDFLAQMNK